MDPDSTRSEMSRLATVGPNRFSMCRSSRCIRVSLLFSRARSHHPSSSCGMYQIWVSVASSPSAEHRPVLEVERTGERVRRPIGQGLDEGIDFGGGLGEETSPLIHPTAEVSGLLMSDQSGPFHSNPGFERPVHHRLGDLEIGWAPVEVWDPETGRRRFLAGALEVVRNRPNRLICGEPLPRPTRASVVSIPLITTSRLSRRSRWSPGSGRASARGC